jgi:hypothetical protein
MAINFDYLIFIRGLFLFESRRSSQTDPSEMFAEKTNFFDVVALCKNVVLKTNFFARHQTSNSKTQINFKYLKSNYKTVW